MNVKKSLYKFFLTALFSFTFVLCYHLFCLAAEGDELSVKQARLHFERGINYFNKKQWEKALEEFQMSFKLKPHWKIRYNIGLCFYKLNFWAEAITELSLMLEEGGEEISTRRVKKIFEILESLNNKVGRFIIEGEIKDVNIFVDGKPIIGLTQGSNLFLNPGEHRLEIKYKGKTIFTKDVGLSAKQVKKLNFDEMGIREIVEKYKQEEDQSRQLKEIKKRKRIREGAKKLKYKERRKKLILAGAILAGLGAGLLLSGAGCGISAMVEKNNLDNAYSDYMKKYESGGATYFDYNSVVSRIDNHYKKAKKSALASSILIPSGGAFITSSIVLFLMAGPGKKKSEFKTAILLDETLFFTTMSINF